MVKYNIKADLSEEYPNSRGNHETKKTLDRCAEDTKRPQTRDLPKLSTTINGENKIFHVKSRFK